MIKRAEKDGFMGIRELNDFLSTDTRKKIFLYYVFSDIAPSDIVDETKIPFSTVDRITQLLKAHGILIESEGRDLREKKYKINFGIWIRQNLEFLGLDFIDDAQEKQIIELLGEKKFFLLSYLFINPDFILDFFKEPLDIGDDLPTLILMDMAQLEDMPAKLPSSILIYLKFSPIFSKLAEDIDSDFLEKDLRLMNKWISSHTMIKDVSIDEDELKKYEENRSNLLFLLKHIFEKRILKMSVKRKEDSKVEMDSKK